MLASPFSPFNNERISLVIFVIKFKADSFCVPDNHIIVDLHAFSVEHYSAEPVRNPGRSIHFMEQSLVVFALRLNVLEKDNLEKIGFEEDVY